MQVAKHLTKLFDCMAALEFEKDDKGEVCSKNALSMYSKDGEQVPLAYVCDCDGQVCASYYTQCLEFLFHEMLIIINDPCVTHTSIRNKTILWEKKNFALIFPV